MKPLPKAQRRAVSGLLDCKLVNQAEAIRHTGGPILYAEEFLSIWMHLDDTALENILLFIDTRHYERTYGIAGIRAQFVDFLVAGPMKRLWPHPLIRFDYVAALRPDLVPDLRSAEDMFQLIAARTISLGPWFSADASVALVQLAEKRICDTISRWIDPAYLLARQNGKSQDAWEAILYFASVEDALCLRPSTTFDPLVWRESQARKAPITVQPFLDFLWRGRVEGFPPALPSAYSVVTDSDMVLSYDAVPWSRDSQYFARNDSQRESSTLIRFPKPSLRGPIAVALHAYYLDAAAEILARLARCDVPLMLYMTTTPAQMKAARKLAAASGLPFKIVACENRGRDIAPFLQLLPMIDADGHQVVLKLHTKRSLHRPDGAAWAGSLIEALTTPERLERGLKALADAPDIGFLGPAGHVLELRRFMGPNRDWVHDLVRRLGVSQRHSEQHGYFIAGSMYLARLSALRPLMALGLQQDAFEVECGQLDGTLAHAVERVTAISGWAVGMKLMVMGDGVANQLDSQVFYPR
ncbi:rhamnan synthesis F family protein [Cypionkella sinensis]|uniref:rhamnan synthesis F family protein n=1 Tax=Cypionkella sinensis TaxID=1756043 RepID=UPI00363F4D65